MSKPTVISLFAGCGGSSLGYRQAGYDELLAVEMDDYAADCFRANFPGVTLWQGDVRDLDGRAVLETTGLQPGDLSVLDSSPPCQGYSMAGARIVDDNRNELWREVLRLASELRPRVVILENVEGITLGSMAGYAVEIPEEFERIGYRCREAILISSDYGVPQERPRFVMLGTVAGSPDVSWPPPSRTGPIPLSAVVWRAESFRSTLYSRTEFGLKLGRKADRPAQTITRVESAVVRVNGRERELTIDEVKSICGFPRSFILPDASRARRWGVLGNCVPPPMAAAWATHIRRSMGW